MFEFVEAMVTWLSAGGPPTSDHAAEPPALDADALLVDEIVELERAKAMIEARVLVLTADLADRSTGWVDPRDERLDDLRSDGSFAAAELAPALHLAPVTAGLRVQRALRLRDFLPATLAALGDGILDIGRVLAIDDATRLLTAENARRVERLVLAKAVNQTAGELRASLRRAVIAVDPDGAEQRRQAAVKQRGVTRYQREDGTSALEAVLSAIDTGEIYDLVDEMAKRTKTTDDTRSLDARRADAFVWLMLGRDPHLGPEDPGEPEGPDDPEDPELADPGAPQGPGPTASAGPADEASPTTPCPPPEPPIEAHLEFNGGEEPGAAAPVGDVHQPDQPHEDSPTDAGRRDEDRNEDFSGSHMLGTADGEDAGWSQWPDARESALRDAELSRFDRIRDARTAEISELASLALSAMTSRRPQRPRWVAVREVQLNRTTVLVGELEGFGPITGECAQALLDSGAAHPPDPPSGREPTAEQADRHDPPGWLDTDIRARDGTCRAPGCRRPSSRGDLDHTVPFPHGKTVAANLGALCRRHHRLKHSGAWHVTQDDAARYTWTSTVTGRGYVTHPRAFTGEWQGTTPRYE